MGAARARSAVGITARMTDQTEIESLREEIIALRQQIQTVLAAIAPMAKSIIASEAKNAANAHIGAVLMSFLDEAGVVGPHAFAARLEATLTIFPEGPVRAHVETVAI